MVDTVEAFKRQFDPVDDGYLYYPSPNSGGKLISHEEYEGLLRDWTNASKGKRFWLMLGAIMGVILYSLQLNERWPCQSGVLEYFWPQSYWL